MEYKHKADIEGFHCSSSTVDIRVSCIFGDDIMTIKSSPRLFTRLSHELPLGLPFPRRTSNVCVINKMTSLRHSLLEWGAFQVVSSWEKIDCAHFILHTWDIIRICVKSFVPQVCIFLINSNMDCTVAAISDLQSWRMEFLPSILLDYSSRSAGNIIHHEQGWWRRRQPFTIIIIRTRISFLNSWSLFRNDGGTPLFRSLWVFGVCFGDQESSVEHVRASMVPSNWLETKPFWCLSSGTNIYGVGVS